MSTFLRHDEALEILPWFVNGTLSDTEHAKVELHVRSCLPCRIALQEQYRLQALIREQPTVRLSADQHFADLLRKVDRSAGPKRRLRLADWERSLASWFAPWTRRAATIGVLVIGVGLASWLTTSHYSATERSLYSTSSDNTTSSKRLIDIVFANGISEEDKRALVEEIGGTLIEGPSDIGRYTIRLESTDANEQAFDDLIARLQRDKRIRFAGRAFREDPTQ